MKVNTLSESECARHFHLGSIHTDFDRESEKYFSLMFAASLSKCCGVFLFLSSCEGSDVFAGVNSVTQLGGALLRGGFMLTKGVGIRTIVMTLQGDRSLRERWRKCSRMCTHPTGTITILLQTKLFLQLQKIDYLLTCLFRCSEDQRKN